MAIRRKDSDKPSALITVSLDIETYKMLLRIVGMMREDLDDGKVANTSSVIRMMIRHYNENLNG